jgi:excisionase family DNA binding protein
VDEPLALSVEEAARLLGVSRTLAYESVARGELPSVRLGKRIVVPRRALDELLEIAIDRDPG